MAQHVKILGILHIIFGALGVLAAIIVLMIFGGISAIVGLSDHSPDNAAAAPILGVIGGFVFFLVLVLSLPGLVAGIGLIQYRSLGAPDDHHPFRVRPAEYSVWHCVGCVWPVGDAQPGNRTVVCRSA